MCKTFKGTKSLSVVSFIPRRMFFVRRGCRPRGSYIQLQTVLLVDAQPANLARTPSFTIRSIYSDEGRHFEMEDDVSDRYAMSFIDFLHNLAICLNV